MRIHTTKSNIAPLVGKAGEYAVAAQLLLREIPVFFPSVDSGVDLMTPAGCRIQVKSAHISTTEKMIAHHGEGAYAFMIPYTRNIPMSTTRARIAKRRRISDISDVVVFWGIEQNRFWIAPSSMCEGTAAFILGRTSQFLPRFIGKVEDLREMVRLGYKHHEIADKYGVGRVTITRLLNNPDFEAREPDTVTKVRGCENAWHYITEFERSREPLNSLVETQQEVL